MPAVACRRATPSRPLPCRCNAPDSACHGVDAPHMQRRGHTMRDMYLIGIGQTAVSKHSAARGRYLMANAIVQAIAHAGIDPAEIGMLAVGNMLSGILAQQQQFGALYTDVAGL